MILESRICKALPKKLICTLNSRRYILSRFIGGLYCTKSTSLKAQKQLYDSIAQIYQFHADTNRVVQLKEFLPFLKKGSRVLDASAGDCRFAKAARGRFNLYCSDISKNMLNLRPKGLIQKDHIAVCSASNLPFQHSFFDAVVHTFSNQYAWDKRFFKEFLRVLKPHGILLYHPVKSAGEQWPKDHFQKIQADLKAAGYVQIQKRSVYCKGKKKTTLVFFLAQKPE